MPTAPTGQEPSRTHRKLGDDQAPAYRSRSRTTHDAPKAPNAPQPPSEPLDDATADET